MSSIELNDIAEVVLHGSTSFATTFVSSLVDTQYLTHLLRICIQPFGSMHRDRGRSAKLGACRPPPKRQKSGERLSPLPDFLAALVVRSRSDKVPQGIILILAKLLAHVVEFNNMLCNCLDDTSALEYFGREPCEFSVIHVAQVGPVPIGV